MKKIKGTIKHYAWGGYSFIASILGQEPGDTPNAELWFGDHKDGAANLEDGSSLKDLISTYPQFFLGEKIQSRYGCRLPFLLKILDVRAPLSIQVHPTLEQARIGFKKECCLDIDPSLRNYKDDNHKPELMLALSDFYLLHGFKLREKTVEELGKYRSFASLLTQYKNLGLKDFVEYIFHLGQEQLNTIVCPVIDEFSPAYESQLISKKESLFWFIRAALQAKKDGRPFDPGLIMIFIMNLVYLTEGQVIFQGAGIPHAYLEGINVELMSNSDNVIRGGLTVKHVDVEELLKITKFEQFDPKLLSGVKKSTDETVYYPPVNDFILSSFSLKKDRVISICSDDAPSIILVLSGYIIDSKNKQEIGSGDAIYLMPDECCELQALSDTAFVRAYCALN